MPTPGHVTVIIPARDAAGTVADAIGALRGGTRVPDAIVVVDDGSTDNTGEVARAAGADVISVLAAGPGLARAAGVRGAPAVPDPTQAVYLFTDSDCVAEPEFVERLVEPVLAGVADATKGAYRTVQRGLVPRFVQVEFLERYRRLAARPTTDFADGHAAAYRRTDFEAAGGFDTRLMLSQNVDLAYRLSEAGKRIVFVPAARVTHRHPERVGAYARAKVERSFWRAQSLWRHPAKAVSDSYTPWSLKIQMGTVAATAVCKAAWLLGGISAGANARFIGLAALVFVASAVPLLILAWRTDKAVVVVALPLLVIRAASLLAGTTAGLIAGAFHLRSPERAPVRDHPPETVTTGGQTTS